MNRIYTWCFFVHTHVSLQEGILAYSFMFYDLNIYIYTHTYLHVYLNNTIFLFLSIHVLKHPQRTYLELKDWSLIPWSSKNLFGTKGLKSDSMCRFLEMADLKKHGFQYVSMLSDLMTWMIWGSLMWGNLHMEKPKDGHSLDSPCWIPTRCCPPPL